MKTYLKNVFTCSLICFYILSYGQQDEQWYLTESYQSESNTRDPNLQHFLLADVYHPDTTATNDTIARNDVLIIYEDGTYYNSRFVDTIPISTWVDNLPPQGYIFNASKPIAYLYFTNVYEGEDAPPRILPPSTATPTPTSQYPTLISIDSFSSNHDIVEDKDITLIVKNPPNSDKETEGTCTYQICSSAKKTINVNGKIVTVSAANILFQESNIFPNQSFVLHGNDAVLSDTCITYHPDLTKPYSYVNLRVPNNLSPENLNSFVNFNFTALSGCTNAGQPYTSLSEQVNLAHDPNFVQVSVGTDYNGDKYARYHVECYNDKPDASVGVLKFRLLMPGHLNIGSLDSKACFLGMKPLESNALLDSLHIDSVGNLIEFTFKDLPLSAALSSRPVDPIEVERANRDLDMYDANNIDRSTGWVEFTIKLPPDADLAHIDLKPIYAKSYFDSLMFNIVEYRDACRTTATKKKKGFLSSCFNSCFCGDQESRVSNMDKWGINQSTNNVDDCCRISSGQCLNNTSLQSGSSSICWLVLTLIGLFFIFFIWWIFRLFGMNRKRSYKK